MKENVEADVLNAMTEMNHNLDRIQENLLLLNSAEAQDYLKSESRLEEIFEAVQKKLNDLSLHNLSSKQEHS